MPTPERWRTVRRLLEGALDLPAERRSAFVERECGGDEALCDEVLRLVALDVDPTEDDLLPSEARINDWLEERLSDAVAGARVGSCVIRRVLGSGGMGTVYEAEQERPRRRVALKMMRIGFPSASARRRFRVEGEVLASLNHPSIAQIFEAGVHREDVGGRSVEAPYLVMELVEHARPVDRYCDDERLPFERRVRLFLDVCDAIQHAHQRGLMHRDLKPANLLVGTGGRVKVIDFGVAGAVGGESRVTAAGERVGTLRYMSPEQRDASSSGIDLRGDVYSLGAVLYELVAGRPWREAVDGVSDAGSEPSPPSRREGGGLEREVGWIIAKATDVDPEFRYATGGELGADLRRALAHEPVLAGPPSTWYRVTKLFRRHRVSLTLAALAASALVMGTIGLALGLTEAERHRRAAEARAQEAQQVVDFLQNAVVAAQPWHSGPDVTVRDLLTSVAGGIDRDFVDQPGVAGALHATVGWTLRALGRPLEAEPHLRRAVECLDQVDDDRERQRIVARHRLALVLGELNRAAEAIGLLEEVVERASARFGADDKLTLSAMDLHACSLKLVGRGAEAVSILEAVCRLSEARYGTRSIETIAHLNNLVAALSAAGRSEEAVGRASDVAAAMRTTFGEGNLDTLVSVQNHAALLCLVGRFAESETLSHEVLRARGPLLGEDHPFNLITRFWIGAAEQGQQRYEEAVATFRGVLRASRERVGDRHASTLRAAVGLAESLLMLGEREEAVALACDVLEDESDALPASDLMARARRVLEAASSSPAAEVGSP